MFFLFVFRLIIDRVYSLLFILLLYRSLFVTPLVSMMKEMSLVTNGPRHNSALIRSIINTLLIACIAEDD